MKNLLYFLPVLFFACSPQGGSADSKSSQLFVEESDEWFEEGVANWAFVNDELVGSLDSGSGFVITKNTYKNFILTLEFNPDSTINSGVFIRCKNSTMSAANCYEINIWDLHPNQDNRTGAVVSRATPLAFVESLNKWNTYEIRCEGTSIKASVNSVQTVDLTDEELSEGFIGLQAAENGKIRFRNVKVEILE